VQQDDEKHELRLEVHGASAPRRSGEQVRGVVLRLRRFCFFVFSVIRAD
jgi:hypothetical protein